MKPENRFISSVNRLLPDSLYRLKMHNMFVGGIADVWYSGEKGDIWVEYKYVEKLPAIVDLTNPKKSYCLSALQMKWLNERLNEGRQVFVILGCAEGGIIFEDGSWMRQWERELLLPIMSKRALAQWIMRRTKGTDEVPVLHRKRVERCV